MEKFIRFIFAYLLLIPLATTSIFANSAPVYWENYAGGESMVIDEDSPIEVLHEELIFDFADSENNWEKKHGMVAASYEMHNTVNKPQKVKMAFPFIGTVMDTFREMESIQVSAAGKQLPMELFLGDVVENETLDYKAQYGIENILHSLHTHEDFKDQACKEYIISITPYGDMDEHEFLEVEVNFSIDPEKTRVIARNATSFSGYGDGSFSVGSSIYPDRKLERRQIHLIVVGEDMDFHVKGYMDGDKNQSTARFDYDVSKRETVFSDILEGVVTESIPNIAEKDRDDDLSMPERLKVRLFNIMERYIYEDNPVVFYEDLKRGLHKDRMQVIYYEVDFGAGEEMQVAVSYPISTSMDRRETAEPLFGYTYLFEPARHWADFGTININIHTNDEVPYMVESSLDFSKQKSCLYTYRGDGLPSDTLTFSLHEEKEVNRLSEFELWRERTLPYLLFFLKPLAILGAIVMGIAGAVLWLRKK